VVRVTYHTPRDVQVTLANADTLVLHHVSMLEGTVSSVAADTFRLDLHAASDTVGKHLRLGRTQLVFTDYGIRETSRGSARIVRDENTTVDLIVDSGARSLGLIAGIAALTAGIVALGIASSDFHWERD
jgi:hypothetical protein